MTHNRMQHIKNETFVKICGGRGRVKCKDNKMATTRNLYLLFQFLKITNEPLELGMRNLVRTQAILNFRMKRCLEVNN
jgi:hypothetical protein